MKKKFSIKITKPIAGKWFGTFQHIIKGSGSDKVDMRKYSAGDSASQINRKRTAKYQELYTNIFQQEKSLTLDMFFDINYNRRGGKIPNYKQVLTYAEDIIYYCQHQQIGINFFWSKRSFWGGKKLEKNVMKKHTEETIFMLHKILEGVKTTKKIYESALQKFLEQAVKEKGRRAIVIFSDFLAMDDKTKKLLHYLKKQHILFLFQIPIDPNQGQNYEYFFLKQTTPKGSGEIELLQID